MRFFGHDSQGLSAEHSLWTPPFLCSLLALILSFLAIISVLTHHIHLSFSIILIAVLFDMLDGALARRGRQESMFGMLFDLLQDVINYLLYPVLLFFTEGFDHWMAITLLCLFLCCGVFRLARFGATSFVKQGDKLLYAGMPVYFNHIGVLIFLLLQPPASLLFCVFWLPISSLLMISTLRFPKPKNLFLWSAVLLGVSAFFVWL